MTAQWGVNTQVISGIYTLNALNSSFYWTTFNAGFSLTNEEWNIFVDDKGNPISITQGANGSALSATQYQLPVFNDQEPAILYPGGNGSWTLTWTGAATWFFTADITGSSSTTTSPISLNVTPSTTGMKLYLTSTGSSATVTMPAGTSVNWTGHGFAANTPVAFQAGTTLDTALVQNQVYYVVSPSTNSFGISATVGGGAITLNGNSVGTIKGYGNWARNMSLVQTSQLSYVGTTVWNPDWTSKFKGISPIRFMQMMRTYNVRFQYGAATFSGTDVSYTYTSGGSIQGAFPAGQVVCFLVNRGDTLPSPLVLGKGYYVLQQGLASTGAGATPFVFKISATKGGSPISFSGGSGSVSMLACVPISDGSIAPEDYLLWGCGSYNNPGGYYGGPPIGKLCALCNEQNADLWLNMPYCADDSWATEAANRISTYLNPGLKVYLELSNEIWSFASFVNPGYAAYSGQKFSTPTNNAWMLYRSIQLHDIFAGILGGGRIVRILPSQGANPGFTQGLLEQLPTDSGGPATWSNGSSTKAANQFDAVCGAVYMTDSPNGQLPDAWTADADGGIAKFYQQYNTGGLLPRFTGESQTWYDTPDTTGGTNTAYTLTATHYWDGSGIHLGNLGAGTPANGTIVLVTFNQTINAAGATLQVGAGTAYPLSDKMGRPVPNGSSAGGTDINAGNTFVVCFTSSTVPSTGQGAADPGNSSTWRWRVLATYGWHSVRGSPDGTMYWGLDFSLADYNMIVVNYGKRFVIYEGGQNFSDFGQPDVVCSDYSVAANRSTEMGLLYNTFFGLAPTYGVRDAFAYLTDVLGASVGANTQSQWGLLESTYQANYQNVPKYKAYMALVTPQTTVNLMGQACL